MKKDYGAVLSCTGAVIGAGFASGREVMVFFSRYGRHAWWLILLAALVMSGLCALCMYAARIHGCHQDWCALLQHRKLPQICAVLLAVMTAGAMIAASGHMIALLWAHPWAYAAGALGTLMLAWLMGFGSMKWLNLLSGLLTMALLCALMAILVRPPSQTVVHELRFRTDGLAAAAVRAAGYAAMNMTLATGVVCRQSSGNRNILITSGLFGWLLGTLLLISHYAYSRHSGIIGKPFPLIEMLSVYGRKGYLFSAGLLYLAILTTLTSLLYTLRGAACKVSGRTNVQRLLTLGAPLAVSGAGFSQIVDRLYAPAGLVCLAVVFLPMALCAAEKRKQLLLDNSGRSKYDENICMNKCTTERSCC